MSEEDRQINITKNHEERIQVLEQNNIRLKGVITSLLILLEGKIDSSSFVLTCLRETLENVDIK